MSTDWENLRQRLQKHSDGTIANPVLLDGLPPNANPKQIGTKLNQIADKEAQTQGDMKKSADLYGFTLLVKTEISEKRGSRY